MKIPITINIHNRIYLVRRSFGHATNDWQIFYAKGFLIFISFFMPMNICSFYYFFVLRYLCMLSSLCTVSKYIIVRNKSKTTFLGRRQRWRIRPGQLLLLLPLWDHSSCKTPPENILVSISNRRYVCVCVCVCVSVAKELSIHWSVMGLLYYKLLIGPGKERCNSVGLIMTLKKISQWEAIIDQW